MEASLMDQLQDIRRRARDLAAGLSAEQLLRRPDPARWCIAECLAHLNTTATQFLPFIDTAIQRGREGKILGKGPFKPGPIGGLLKWFAEPPPKIRLRAPKNILPPASITDPQRVVADFMKAQDEWERQLRESDGLNLKKIICKTPFGRLRLRLAAPIPWMLAHERRHLLQAEKVKAEILAKAANA